MVMHKAHNSSVFDMLMEAMEVTRQGNLSNRREKRTSLDWSNAYCQGKKILILHFLLVCFGPSEV